MSSQLANPKNNLKSIITGDAMKAQFAAALPKHLSVERFCRVAITALSRTPKLMECTQESLMKCLLDLSAYGLEPDGRRAHLIPYENRRAGTVECQLLIDWKGKVELAMRSGIIAKMHADLVCENDEFDFNLGEIVKHRVNFRADRGEPYAAYAMAVTKDGATFVQVLTKAEIEKIRDNSQGYKSAVKYSKTDSPWMTAPGEMWKKSAIHRLTKWLPLSAEFRDAMEIDDDERLPERDVTPIKDRSAPVPELLRDAPVMPPYIPSSDKETIPVREPEPPLEDQPDAWLPPQEEEQEKEPPLSQAPQKPAQSGTIYSTMPPTAEVAKPKEPEPKQVASAKEAANWKSHVVHFGTQTEGKKLGELPKPTLRWFQTEWLPKAKEADATIEDTALIKALEASIQPTKMPA